MAQSNDPGCGPTDLHQKASLLKGRGLTGENMVLAITRCELTITRNTITTQGRKEQYEGWELRTKSGTPGQVRNRSRCGVLMQQLRRKTGWSKCLNTTNNLESKYWINRHKSNALNSAPPHTQSRSHVWCLNWFCVWGTSSESSCRYLLAWL